MSARLLTSLAVVLAAACSGPDSGPDAPDALKGSWRLVSLTTGGATTPDAALDGALVVTGTEYALGIVAPATGIVTTYSLSTDGKMLVLADGSKVPFTLTAGTAPQLTLEALGGTLAFAPASDMTYIDSYPVTGTVTLADGTPPLTAPRAALVFLTRTSTGATSFNNDSRDDVALTFNGKTAAFDLSRNRLGGALGTERIVFGTGTAIAIAYVVVYDGDAAGTLSDLFTPCSGSSRNCVRGVAALVLGFRDGNAPELAASPFSYLGTGWTRAVPATDHRGGQSRQGLVSADVTKMPPFDVTVPVDPAQVVVPKLDLTVPKVK
jgi:hypothetical protein